MIDRDAMHAPVVGQIVGQGVVLCDAVIPDCDRTLAPAESHLKLGLIDM